MKPQPLPLTSPTSNSRIFRRGAGARQGADAGFSRQRHPARRDAESTASLLKMLEALALDGKGESTVFGDAKAWTRRWRRCSTARSAIRLISTTPMRIPRCIPSAPVVPAAFAVGELVGASGRDV